jgi:hypothetical protein
MHACAGRLNKISLAEFAEKAETLRKKSTLSFPLLSLSTLRETLYWRTSVHFEPVRKVRKSLGKLSRTLRLEIGNGFP